MLVGTFDRLTQASSIVMGEQHLSEHSFNYRSMKIDPQPGWQDPALHYCRQMCRMVPAADFKLQI